MKTIREALKDIQKGMSTKTSLHALVRMAADLTAQQLTYIVAESDGDADRAYQYLIDRRR